MARETFIRLHFMRNNGQSVDGFTLLEMLIVIAVMVVLATAAAPSFSSLIDSNKVKRLATEIEWLLVQTKSEAVMRNEELKVHFVRDDGNETVYKNDGEWVIAVTNATTTVTSRNLARNAAILLLDGKDFSKVYTSVTSGSKSYSIDPVRATSSNQVAYQFYIVASKDLKVLINQVSGRIKTCGITGGYYGYEKCS